MKFFACWLPGETREHNVLAHEPPDAAETFADLTRELRSEGDEIDVYVGIGDGRAEAFRVAICSGEVVAHLVGIRIRKVGAT